MTGAGTEDPEKPDCHCASIHLDPVNSEESTTNYRQNMASTNSFQPPHDIVTVASVTTTNARDKWFTKFVVLDNLDASQTCISPASDIPSSAITSTPSGGGLLPATTSLHSTAGFDGSTSLIRCPPSNASSPMPTHPVGIYIIVC